MLDMRTLMEQERPAKGDWDLKLAKGGLVDIEFIAQLLQIIQAPNGGLLEVNTAKALATAPLPARVAARSCDTARTFVGSTCSSVSLALGAEARGWGEEGARAGGRAV
jgi:glutamine synthetase adenylyltransferase